MFYVIFDDSHGVRFPVVVSDSNFGIIPISYPAAESDDSDTISGGMIFCQNYWYLKRFLTR